MGWLLSILHDGMTETPLIFSVFHLLVAGLTLVVLLYQRRSSVVEERAPDHLPAGAFAAFVANFALLTALSGARLFLYSTSQTAGLERLGQGFFVAGLLLLGGRRSRWLVPACVLVIGVAVADTFTRTSLRVRSGGPYSLAMLATDAVAVVAIALAVKACVHTRPRCGHMFSVLMLGVAVLLHAGSPLLPADAAMLAWNAGQVALSASMVGFAWAAGERSSNLLGRIFVRLNLTFIVLATMVMLVTTTMQKYQYMRIAEQRSTELGDFLRDEVLHYHYRGESLEQVVRHGSIADRIGNEFLKIPELRRVDIHLGGENATFAYSEQAWQLRAPANTTSAANGTFTLLALPLDTGPRDRIDLICTLDYINRYIGKYVLFIYGVFTVVVLLSTCIIGIIVAETDRQLQRKFTELQQTHEQLAQAAKLASVGELAGGMAHQINTPITSILSLATHMVDDKSSAGLTPRQRKSLDIIAQQAQRASTIVRGLLNFSRQSQLRLSRVQLGEVLDVAVSLVHYRLEGSSIRLQRQVEPGLAPVHADAGALTEVVVNLLNNAMDAMPSGGDLTLRAYGDGDGTVRLEVSDTGIGIPAEELPRIFDPFYTTKEPGRGTGLGLSISHGIITNHGGNICAYSEPGQGTTVSVTLPRERTDEETYSCHR